MHVQVLCKYECLVDCCLFVCYFFDSNFIYRQGSGSACRSMFGGWVMWEKGVLADGSDSKAIQVGMLYDLYSPVIVPYDLTKSKVYPEEHWTSIHILVLVVNDSKKAVGSSEGMRWSVQTSPTIHVSYKLPLL